MASDETLAEHGRGPLKLRAGAPNLQGMSRSLGKAPVVLTIDDSLMARTVLRRALVGAGFEVLEAVDGLDGLKKLTGEVACVLCDVNMPRMNGFEFLSAARGAGRPLPPVLMITAHENDRPPGAREMGVVGWIVKPFDPELVVTTVRGLVNEPGNARMRLHDRFSAGS